MPTASSTNFDCWKCDWIDGEPYDEAYCVVASRWDPESWVDCYPDGPVCWYGDSCQLIVDR